jgi:iron complex outermembrane receptor protein
MDESLNGSFITPLADLQAPSGFSDALVWFGKNSELQEETATIFTIGAEIKPVGGPFSGRLTFFDITFKDRIQGLDFSSDVLDERFSALVTPDPSLADRQQVCSNGTFFGSPDGCLNFPIAAIVDLRLNNIAETKTRGFDLSASYAFATRAGDFTATAMATYLLDFAQAIVSTAPTIDLLNTRSFPVDLRARAALSWTRQGFNVTTFVNYVDGYEDPSSSVHPDIGSWTTIDATASYDLGASSAAWLKGTSVSLRVLNLFDRDPPFVDNPVGIGYDPENADLMGRFVSLRIRKQW